jgi:hypothetical protein
MAAVVAAVAVETSRATNAEATVSNAAMAAVAVETSRATNVEAIVSNMAATASVNALYSLTNFVSIQGSSSNYFFYSQATRTLYGCFTNVNTVSNVAMLVRYDAYPEVANTIWVLATATNVTASRSGATFTFVIPSGTRVLEKKIRVDGANTDSGNIYIVLGTNDVNQTALATYWNCVPSAFREDTLANVPVTCTPYSGDNSQQKVSGLGTVGGIWYHVELR